MFIDPMQGAPAPTASAAHPSAAAVHSGSTAEPIRHMLFGTPQALQATIQHLHKRGYADPNDWSRPISTGRANEVMAILTKRVRLE